MLLWHSCHHCTPKQVTVVAAVDSCWLPWLFPGAQAGSVDLAHMTALHHACLASAGGCVDHLLAQPGTVLDSRDVSGCTALLYCLKNKNRNLEKATLSLPRVPSHLYSRCPSLPPSLPPSHPPSLPPSHPHYISPSPTAAHQPWSKSHGCSGLWVLRALLPHCAGELLTPPQR